MHIAMRFVASHGHFSSCWPYFSMARCLSLAGWLRATPSESTNTWIPLHAHPRMATTATHTNKRSFKVKYEWNYIIQNKNKVLTANFVCSQLICVYNTQQSTSLRKVFFVFIRYSLAAHIYYSHGVVNSVLGILNGRTAVDGVLFASHDRDPV